MSCHKCKWFKCEATEGYEYSEMSVDLATAEVVCGQGEYDLGYSYSTDQVRNALSKGDNCLKFEDLEAKK